MCWEYHKDEICVDGEKSICFSVVVNSPVHYLHLGEMQERRTEESAFLVNRAYRGSVDSFFP